MPILVSDMSVIVDLDRGDLLEAAFGIGEVLATPDYLFARELDQDFGARLRACGLRIEPLEGNEVATAALAQRADSRLSIADAFAFALARGRGWPLLTGNAPLRALAAREGLQILETLWVVDRVEAAGLKDCRALLACLARAMAHPRCRLPKAEVDARLRRYARNLEPPHD